MFPVQLNGSELNKCQCKIKTEDKLIINGSIETELVPGIKNGLITRRPTALQLTPIDTNLSCGSSEIDGRRNGSFTVSNFPKSIDIGFSELTYTVKTGFFKKGLYILDFIIFI